MGLDNLVNEDSENDNKINKKETSSSQTKYVTITVDEFEEFLEDNTPYFWRVVSAEAKEIVYQTDEFMLMHPDVSLRIFSSIDIESGVSRGKGKDAIRTIIWSNKIKTPLGGRSRTHRIGTWRKNLNKKIYSLRDEWEDYLNPCPNCSGWLIEREGKHGKFLGCTNWSKDGNGCNYLERLENPDDYVKECPECDNGVLVEREGPYGEFLGCTNWNKDGTGCNHKEKVP